MRAIFCSSSFLPSSNECVGGGDVSAAWPHRASVSTVSASIQHDWQRDLRTKASLCAQIAL
eukprot:3495904-Rhodomonas_salina.1